MTEHSLDVAAGAAALLGAHGRHAPIDGLPPGSQPRTVAEAYAIQAALTAGYPSPVAGYKIGAASAASQALVGAEGPFTARVFADTLFAAPATITPGRFFTPAVEAELAFRIGRQVLPAASRQSREAVVACIAAAYPAIEICDNRFTDWRQVGLAQLVADNGFYGGLVLGDPIPGWQDLDLAQTFASMAVDGVTLGSGRCSAVLGDPVDSVGWLLQALGAQGLTVEAGAVVAIGTWTGLFAVKTGQRAMATFDGYGAVSIQF